MKNTVDLRGLDLDWRRAIRRFSKDIRDDFCPDPVHYQDLTGDTAKTETRLKALEQAFRPTPATEFYIPKAGLTLRCCLHLTPLDRIVYQALADALMPLVDPRLEKSVFSHRYRGDDAHYVFLHPVTQWRRFEAELRNALIENPGAFVVATDISQYFESLNFHQLKRQLRNVIGDAADARQRLVLSTLIDCLAVWSPYRHHGLPQNMDPSSFVGNAYLDFLDKSITADDASWKYFRYLDDIRMVVPTEADARRALVRLVAQLRTLGLGLNSGKTKILRRGDAEYADILKGDSEELTQIEAAFHSKQRNNITRAIPLLFGRIESLIKVGRTGEREFRFLINRLAAAASFKELTLPDQNATISAVLALLRDRPSDTDTFCRYLRVAPLNTDHESALAKLISNEPLCVYEWQNYHLWQLAVQRNLANDDLLRKARKVAVSAREPECSGAALYLGRFGTYADRHSLRHKFDQERASVIRRRNTLVAVQELNPAERTEFFRGAAPDDASLSALPELLQGATPVYAPRTREIDFEELVELVPSNFSA